MVNILLIIVAAIIIVCAIVGAVKGVIKILFATFGLIIVLACGFFFTNQMADFLTEHTGLYTSIYEKSYKYVDTKVDGVVDSATETVQSAVINTLPMPSLIRNSLIEHNSQESYIEVGAHSFSEYVAASIAKMIVKAISFVLVVILAAIILAILRLILTLIAKLPVFRTVNRFLGVIIGVIQGLLIVGLVFIVITMFGTTTWGQAALTMVNESQFLTFLYDNNFLMSVITGIFSI